MNAVGAIPPVTTPAARIRIDLQQVADLVPPGSRVLDVGCGDGTLLAYLTRFKQVDGRGLELSMAKVRAAVGHEHVAPGRKHDPGEGFDWGLVASGLAVLGWNWPSGARAD